MCNEDALVARVLEYWAISGESIDGLSIDEIGLLTWTREVVLAPKISKLPGPTFTPPNFSLTASLPSGITIRSLPCSACMTRPCEVEKSFCPTAPEEALDQHRHWTCSGCLTTSLRM